MAVALAGILLLESATGASAQAVLQSGWTQLSPATVPPARAAAGIAYDSATAQIVLFGGGGSTFLNDTWVWNGASWVNATPASGNPAARRNLSMAYDAATQQVVMFGGNATTNPSTPVVFGDTWVWNGTSWSQTSSSGPSARSSAVMAYDAATQQVVLFGGADTNGNLLGDTWVWNGSSWSQASPSASPSARIAASIAYDAALGELILFGGFDGNYDNDLWAWNGSTWTRLSPANTPPSGRQGSAMEYDAALGQIILFGGANGSSSTWVGDTWVLTGTSNSLLAWTQVTTGPSARNVSAMAWDAVQGQVLLFGGESSTGNLGDTWTWAGDPRNFGNVNVCPSGATTPAPCSVTVPLTFTFTGNAAVSAIRALTQGVTGLDFSAPNSGTCINSFTAGQSCTVNVTFAPLAPGLRLGALELATDTGQPVATALIYGKGQAPQPAFAPATQSPVLATGTLNGPEGVVVDAAGDVFVADSGNARVLEIAGNSAQSSIGFGLSHPQALALDGAGDLFIADNNTSGAVIEIPSGCAQATCQKTIATGLQSVVGVAVDGLGDLFLSDFNDGEVAEIPANGAALTVLYKVAGSFPHGLAVDSAGDLFIAAFGFGQVIELPAGCTSSACAVK
ncbi:MAG TPA: hypothetical protein VKT75_05990, partial [Acidobacteriaceae bacterium]|nr:hypothetical protein [Acidobacteriaceae bacterium]